MLVKKNLDNPGGIFAWTGSMDCLVSALTAKKTSEQIIFNCLTSSGKKRRVYLTPVTEHILRLRMSASGSSLSQKTEMTVSDARDTVNYSFVEYKNSFEIRTKGMKVVINKNPWRLKAYNLSGKEVFAQTNNLHRSLPLAVMRDKKGQVRGIAESFHLSPDEHIYGLGERFLRLDRTGQEIILWATDPQRPDSSLSYKNIPFFMSTKGYGLFINSSFPVTYEIGNKAVETVSLKVEGEEIDYFIITGSTLKEILYRYCLITGFAPVPPLWSFGLWMSRHPLTPYSNSTEVLKVAERLRKEKIPSDVISLDPYWMHEGKDCDFVWDDKTFPHPEEMLKKLREKGFRLCLWEQPYISVGSEMYKEGKKQGYFVKDKKGRILHRRGWKSPRTAVVDFTNPGAVKWYQEKHKTLIEQGVSTFKTDFGEGAPAEGYYHNKMTGKEAHNLYPLLYNKTVFETVKKYSGGRGIVWGRSGYAGSQRYPACWAGDSDSSFEAMASVLRGGLSLGLSGIPFWSHDIGGFIGTPSREVYIRSAQWGLLISHSRCHGRTPREPWHFGKEATRIFRKYANLRYRLLPYIYSCAHISSKTGMPTLRPLILDYENDPNVYNIDLQYLFGEAFLVAPIFNSSGERDIYLPEGRWFDYWTGKERHGPGNIKYKADLDTLPLFVKDNSLIPMLKNDIAHTGEMDLERDLLLDVYCSSQARFTYHDDNGAIDFKCEREGSLINFSASKAAFNYILKLNQVPGPKMVKINGERISAVASLKALEEKGSGYTYSQGTLWIYGGKNKKIEVFLKGDK